MTTALLVDNATLLAMDGAFEAIPECALVIDGGRVAFAGPRSQLQPQPTVKYLDAGGALVTPGLCDPHAHLVFAGSRAHEFDLRAQGKSYLEIQQAGGGILSTVRATRDASNAELLDGTMARLDRFLAHGVTCVEAKSGYELTCAGELRLLGVLAAARERHVIDLSPTLLAHVPPPDQDRARFVDEFCSEAIPRAADGELCEAVDVYCDQGAFTLDETRLILQAARDHDLLLRVHAEQFTRTGAAELAASMQARSVEHLEQLSPFSAPKLARAGTVCNLLPGAALTLALPWPDARPLYSAGCRVALGTDCNPGSSLTENLPLMMSLACMQMHMSCEQAWRAVTLESAHALARDDAGRLVPGARGDLVVWDAADPREVVQHFGASLVRSVVIAGNLAYERGRYDARR
jgi:imidazolonepropionase